MNDNFNLINHYYILRVVIYSVFLFKDKSRNKERYNFEINAFIKKRIAYDIELVIKDEDVDKDDVRKNLIADILNGSNYSKLNIINLSFVTPIRKMNIKIDLNKIEDYEKWLYN